MRRVCTRIARLHPPVTELVAVARGERTSVDVAAHLESCALCRQLVGLAASARYLTRTRHRA